MKLTFLGTATSQGVPVIGCDDAVCLSENPKDKRLRSSVMLEWEGSTYIIDSGPDFRQQMLRENVQRIDGILYTHEHTDHIIGLDDFRPFFYKQKEDMPLYAEPRVMQEIAKRFEYIFGSTKYPGKPNVIQNILKPNSTIVLGNKKIDCIRVMHSSLPILSFKVDNLIYMTDVKTVPSESMHYFENLDVLIVNALRNEEHHGHFTLKEALDFIDKVKPKRAYLTHVSHLLGLHEEVSKALPKNVFLAYDGLTLTTE